MTSRLQSPGKRTAKARNRMSKGQNAERVGLMREQHMSCRHFAICLKRVDLLRVDVVDCVGHEALVGAVDGEVGEEDFGDEREENFQLLPQLVAHLLRVRVALRFDRCAFRCFGLD